MERRKVGIGSWSRDGGQREMTNWAMRYLWRKEMPPFWLGSIWRPLRFDYHNYDIIMTSFQSSQTTLLQAYYLRAGSELICHHRNRERMPSLAPRVNPGLAGKPFNPLVEFLNSELFKPPNFSSVDKWVTKVRRLATKYRTQRDYIIIMYLDQDSIYLSIVTSGNVITHYITVM